MIVSVDAMGGDFAPEQVVKGAVKAVNNFSDTEVILVGNKDRIIAELDKCSASNHPRIRIHHAEQVIEMDDHPSEIVRGKRKSSMHEGLKLVKNGDAHAFFSAGNSGAVMAVAMVTLGLLEGVSRPAIGTILPCSSPRGYFFMLDVGANVDCKPEHLLTFSIMGSAYARKVLKINDPSVGLLNNGEEEGKGDMLAKTVYPILKNCEPIRFVGNVEGKALYKGEADVVACDGFVGNIALKVSESVSNFLFKTLKAELMGSLKSKIGAMMSKEAFMNVRKRGDSSQYGGAPLLGVKGVCVIGHGSSDDVAVLNGIRVAREAVVNKVNEAITDDVKNALTNIINSKYFL
ncbi:MAG: phosphate acyltransferase PlsX [Deferribacterales bacterium]|nr:phosphate acyltransferase PlsX [Deferribacterales bacterium]